jgi:hypothetical protein
MITLTLFTDILTVLGAILVIGVLIICSHFIIVKARYGRIYRQIAEGNYSKALAIANETPRLLDARSLTAQILRLNIAMICVDLKKHDEFIKYINSIENYRIFAYRDYWKIIELFDTDKLANGLDLAEKFLETEYNSFMWKQEYINQKLTIEVLYLYFKEHKTTDLEIVKDLQGISHSEVLANLLQRVIDAEETK